MVRYLGSELPAPVAAFIRYVASTVFFLPLIYRMFFKEAKTEKIKLYFARGLTHGFGVILWFFAMTRIPVSEVTAIGYMIPIFVTIAAFIFLKESLSIKSMIALLVGFIGMFIIVKPTSTGLQLGQMSMIFATVFFASSYILAKKMTDTNSSMEVLASLNAIVTATLAPFAIFFWQTPSIEEIVWLALVGFFATCGHFTMTMAFKLAPISVTQPVIYVQLVWATLIGFMFFGEIIDLWFIWGALLIILATGYISIFARKLPDIEK
jgi:drug/metabolite transporter (DMT)-like permease